MKSEKNRESMLDDNNNKQNKKPDLSEDNVLQTLI